MTGHGDGCPGAPIRLAEHLSSRLTEAVDRMVAAITAEVPFYATLPAEQLSGEIAAVCRRNLLAYLRCAREGRPPTEPELDGVREPAARRAEEGVPLDAVLLAWEVGNRVTWELLAEGARPEDLADLLAATRHLRHFLHAYVRVVSATYVAERQAIEREAGGGLRALADQLLTGGPTAQLAARAAVRVAPGYVVLAVSLTPAAAERGSGVAAQIATRRKVRRVQARLDAVAGEPVLSTLGGTGGLVLFPVLAEPVGRERMHELVTGLAAEADGPVTAAASWATSPAGVPEAAAQSADLLEVATALSAPPRLYVLEDLLLELPLLQSPVGRRGLAALLAPAEAIPELLPTLQAWLSHDRNRRETAEALYVHPNTLDRRLERLAGLTGLDLSTARGTATAQAALAARAIERSGAGRSRPAGGRGAQPGT